MMPPASVVERLVAEQMERSKAQARVAEFGRERWEEALLAVDYADKPPRDRAAWMVDYVLKKRGAPKRLIEFWERQAAGAKRPSEGPADSDAAVVTSAVLPAALDVPGQQDEDPADLDEIAEARREWFAEELPQEKLQELRSAATGRMAPILRQQMERAAAEGRESPRMARMAYEEKRREILDEWMAQEGGARKT
jgi:hypothetical protein